MPGYPIRADLVIHGVCTREGFGAIASRGDRILAVGTADELAPLIGPETRVLHGEGGLLLPGFNDAHVHFVAGGTQLGSIDLRDAATPEEFTRRVETFAAGVRNRGLDPRKAPQAWITEGSWDHENWPDAPLPTREWIDAVTPDIPVFVNRLDWHMALANSLALRLAEITRDTPDPVGGVIVRDAAGEPTGILKDAAMGLVFEVLPEPSRYDRLQDARAATEHAASLGVTSVQDMSTAADIGLLQEMDARGELKTRVYGMTLLPHWRKLQATGIRAPFGTSMLRIGGVKAFSDGSLGSGTALFFEDYSDEPGNHGVATDEMFPEGAMLKRVRGADAAGLQVMIHAIGDRANHEILSIYEEVLGRNGPRDRRWRIEHAQHLRPQDIPRFAAANVIASMQPYHAADDGRWAERRLGRERCRLAYPFRSLLNAGARLALGTDWPVAPLDPRLTLYAGVTRRTLDGAHPDGWIPEEKLTLAEAVDAYTTGAAFAEFADHDKGRLQPGYLADFVLLDRDMFSLPPEAILEARVRLTVVGGRIVHAG